MGPGLRPVLVQVLKLALSPVLMMFRIRRRRALFIIEVPGLRFHRLHLHLHMHMHRVANTV